MFLVQLMLKLKNKVDQAFAVIAFTLDTGKAYVLILILRILYSFINPTYAL